MIKILLPLAILTMIGCDSVSTRMDLENANMKITALNQKLEKLQTSLEPEGRFIHIVLFDLRDGASSSDFIRILKELAYIEGVHNFQIGRYQEVNDPRALSQYEIGIKMSFSTKKSYEMYQNDSKHLELKAALGDYLAGPPASYDYVKV